MSNRDTQFQGFAKLLISEMEPTPVDGGTDPVQRIAQHIYDFACHVMDHTSERMAASIEAGLSEPEEWVENIPDLPKWEQPNQETQVSDDFDWHHPKSVIMIPIGEIKLNLDLFVDREAVEKRFPFHFHDILYGRDVCPETEEDLEVSGCPSLVRCLFSSLTGQIVKLPSGNKARLQQVYVNYWQQIGAHGIVIDEEETPS